jgi:hypothetical protein
MNPDAVVACTSAIVSSMETLLHSRTGDRLPPLQHSFQRAIPFLEPFTAICVKHSPDDAAAIALKLPLPVRSLPHLRTTQLPPKTISHRTKTSCWDKRSAWTTD